MPFLLSVMVRVQPGDSLDVGLQEAFESLDSLEARNIGSPSSLAHSSIYNMVPEAWYIAIVASSRGDFNLLAPLSGHVSRHQQSQRQIRDILISRHAMQTHPSSLT